MNRRFGRSGACWAAAALFVSALAGCGGGGGGGGGANNPPGGAVPKATAVGAATGAVESKTIGAAGGDLTSADGKVTVTVPAGALSADTDIGIQPIDNNAHGGVGSGYRFTPDGQVFTAPVTLTFTYTDADVLGTAAAALGAAFQDANGFWDLLAGAVVDTGAKTVSVETDHFTDFSLVKGFQILPHSATLQPLDAIPLKVVYCFDPVSDPDLTSLAYTCDGQSFIDDPDLAPLIPTATVSDWRANGIAGGNGTVGTVAGGNKSAVYTAPGSAPASNPVAVSAKVKWQGGTATVVANITVVDGSTLQGPIHFEDAPQHVVGDADVTWTRFEVLPDVQRFLGSANLNVTISLPDCDPLATTLGVNTGTPDVPHSTLVRFEELSGFPKKYFFGLGTNPKDLTFSCGEPRAPVTIKEYVYVLAVCLSTDEFPAYTDPADLSSSSWTCTDEDVTANWDFTPAP